MKTYTAAVFLLLSCSACTVVSVAGTAVSTTVSVVGTVVETGVSVAGSAVRGVASAVSGPAEKN
jgi:phosphate/sulfate permease